MKWPWSKKSKAKTEKKKKRSSRLEGSPKRRRTGIVPELPRGVRYALEALVVILSVFAIAWGCKALFYLYFKTNPQFKLTDLHQNVRILTGKTVTPDLVIQALGLKEGKNLFDADIEERAKQFLLTPNIRDITITRELPGKLNITILEREPIARVSVKQRGWVVDEEGVIFVRYVGTGNLPMIIVSDEYAQAQQGARLNGTERAAVRVVKSLMRPECSTRLLELDARKTDYLTLMFKDFRKSKFAWDGMENPCSDEGDAALALQLDRLVKSMDSEIGRSRQFWDATQTGRIFAMPIPASE